MTTQSLVPASPEVTRTRPVGRLAWILLAGVLALVGAFAALLWSSAVTTAVTASLEAATHGPPSGVTVTTHPDPWFVYTEDGSRVSHVSVTAPDGSTLPVTLTSSTFGYGPHREGRQVARFEVPAGAGLVDLRVVVDVVGAAQSDPAATVAVTTFDVAGFENVHRWGLVTLLVVDVGAATAVLVAGGAGRAAPGSLSLRRAHT